MTELKQGTRIVVTKLDKRAKKGFRDIEWLEYPNTNESDALRQAGIESGYSYKAGYRFTVEPMTKMVKNLMSGKMVEIDFRTPYYLDPSRETYWSR